MRSARRASPVELSAGPVFGLQIPDVKSCQHGSGEEGFWRREQRPPSQGQRRQKKLGSHLLAQLSAILKNLISSVEFFIEQASYSENAKQSRSETGLQDLRHDILPLISDG